MLAYNLGGVEQKGATVILRLTGDAEGDGPRSDAARPSGGEVPGELRSFDLHVIMRRF